MKKEENDFSLKLQFPALEVIVVLCIFYVVKKIRNALLSHSILWGNQTRKIAKSHFLLFFRSPEVTSKCKKCVFLGHQRSPEKCDFARV